MLNGLYAQWVANGSTTALLGFGNSRTLRALVNWLFGPGPAGELRRSKASELARLGMMESVSHDATFKFLFSVLGQVKMDQKPGGVHAAHTFCAGHVCLGFSPQRTESPTCFSNSVGELIPQDARNAVRFLYSDSPAKYMMKHFPNLEGIAEDALHLVFRVENCFGGRRNALSREVLCLQLKFQNAPSKPMRVYRGEKQEETGWSTIRCATEKSRQA